MQRLKGEKEKVQKRALCAHLPSVRSSLRPRYAGLTPTMTRQRRGIGRFRAATRLRAQVDGYAVLEVVQTRTTTPFINAQPFGLKPLFPALRAYHGLRP